MSIIKVIFRIVRVLFLTVMILLLCLQIPYCQKQLVLWLLQKNLQLPREKIELSLKSQFFPIAFEIEKLFIQDDYSLKIYGGKINLSGKKLLLGQIRDLKINVDKVCFTPPSDKKPDKELLAGALIITPFVMIKQANLTKVIKSYDQILPMLQEFKINKYQFEDLNGYLNFIKKSDQSINGKATVKTSGYEVLVNSKIIRNKEGIKTDSNFSLHGNILKPILVDGLSGEVHMQITPQSIKINPKFVHNGIVNSVLQKIIGNALAAELTFNPHVNEEDALLQWEIKTAADHRIEGKLRINDYFDGSMSWYVPDVKIFNLSEKYFAKNAVIKTTVQGLLFYPKIYIEFFSSKMPFKQANANIKLTANNLLELSGDLVAEGQNTLQINCNYDLQKSVWSGGKINLHAMNLQTIGAWVECPLGGALQINGDVFLANNLANCKVNLSVDGKNLQIYQANIHKLIGNIITKNEEWLIDAAAQGGQWHSIPFTFIGNGLFNSLNNIATLKKFDLHLADNSIKLQKLAVWHNNSLVEKITFLVNRGKIIIDSLKLVDKKIVGCAYLEKIPLELTKIFTPNISLGGNINGKGQILESGQWDIQLNSNNLSVQQKNNPLLNNLIVKAKIDNDKGYKWQISLYDKNYLSINTNGHTDVNYKILSSNIKGNMKLSLVSEVLAISDRIYGNISLDLQGKGSVYNPQLFGEIKLVNGLYENPDAGTFFKSINLTAHAKGYKIIIESLVGEDGVVRKGTTTAGQVHGSGSIDITNLLQPKFNICLSLKDTQIANSDTFIGNATGDLFLAGEGGNVGAKGNIDLMPAFLYLAEAADDKISSVIILNPKKIKKKKQMVSQAFPLNLNINIPKKFSINGFGIESYWQGNIKIVGPIANPQMLGEIDVINGTLDFFGKRLKIIRGVIIYDEEAFNDPLLDLVFFKETPEKEMLYIKIKGRGSKPDFQFTSSPVMSQEEVVCFLLFGKKLGQISVMQSVQLATTLASLKGNKGLNFIDKIRSGLGFDAIEIKEYEKRGELDNGTTGQAVSLSKEFGKVIVAIDQGAGSESSKLNVLTSITDNLSISAEVGASHNSGIGVNYIKRYGKPKK